MTRIKTLAVFGTALAIASTAALAQSQGAGPDFSPMMPDTSRTEGTALQGDTPVRSDNRMLDAYESSNTVQSEPAAPPVAVETYRDTYVDTAPAPRRGGAVSQPIPRQSLIGNGLFDRRGPNDFGA